MGVFQKVESAAVTPSPTNVYYYKTLDFNPVEDGYAYVAETFWGSIVLIRIDENDHGIWLRFHYENTDNIGDEDGFYNKLLYVYSMEDAMKEANEIYERCLSQQLDILDPKKTKIHPSQYREKTHESA